MRIIAGEKKGHKLASLAGNMTRPTADCVREAIFSMIYDCEDLDVLDLFAGSGIMGFEALSRGAKSLESVESSDKAVKIILKNKDLLNYSDKAYVHHKKADTFIKTTLKKYDLIFLDPPYEKGLVNLTLGAVYENNLLSEDGLIVVEHSVREKIWDDFQDYIEKQKKYGDTMVTIFNGRSESEQKGDTDVANL